MQGQEHLERLKKLVLDFLKKDEVRVLLFGSRARGNFNPGSDVDVIIIPKGDFDKKKLALLRLQIEDSTVPYKVEIVDFETLSENFKKEILKEAIVWKD